MLRSREVSSHSFALTQTTLVIFYQFSALYLRSGIDGVFKGGDDRSIRVRHSMKYFNIVFH